MILLNFTKNVIFVTTITTFAYGNTAYFIAEGPSFKCSEAKTPAEKAICESRGLDNRLEEFDNLLTALFKKALEYSKSPEGIKTDQRKWLAKRQSTNLDKLLKSYDERIQQLLQDKNLVLHLCSIVFSPKAQLNKKFLLGRDPSYVFCSAIPIAEKPNFFLNQLLIAYLMRALIAPIDSREVDMPTYLGMTECYRVNDHLYLAAFSYSGGAHTGAYKLFLIQVKEGRYEIKPLKIPHYDEKEKQIQYDNGEFIGSLSYDSINKKVSMNTFWAWMAGYDEYECELKNNELVLIKQKYCDDINSEEHQKAVKQGKNEDEYGRIWNIVYDLNEKGSGIVNASESIQGKKYAGRINGIYDSNITNEMVVEYLDKLKEAVKGDNPEKVSELISYPCNLTCNLKGHPNIKDKKMFKILYRRIFTDSLKKLIMNTGINDLSVNYQGFMIGRGEVWFIPGKGIISIVGK